MSVTAVMVMNGIRQLLINCGIFFVLGTIGVLDNNTSHLYLLPLFIFSFFVSEVLNQVPLRSSIMQSKTDDTE